MKSDLKDTKLAELTSLFFATRQIIRSQMPSDTHHDPNAWLRFETLHFISENENPTMLELAKHLRIKAPSATSLVANLAKAGFIIRAGEKYDKRVVRIALTKRGEKELTQYSNRSRQTMRNVFSKLTNREIQDLTAILRRLRDIHRN